MIKRILLAFLLAWMAIAPAIASSCAVGCEAGADSMHQATDERAHTDASDVPDCHGPANAGEDQNMPGSGSMAVACFVASAVSLPSSSISLVKIDVISVQHSFVPLPPLSFQTSAPARPPQA